MIDRVRFGTQIPYLVDQDLVTDVVDIAGYIDLDLHIGKRLTLRGGLRQEYFSYDIQNNCAAQAFVPTAPLNVPCQSLDLAGPRLPSQTTTASGFVTEPKGTVLYQLDKAFTATASAGIGAQSLDARYITQDEIAPFSQLWALEAGVLYHRRSAELDLSGRLVAYYTHVNQELIFDPNEGRLNQSGGTSRGGGVFSMRAVGSWFDELLSATYAYAVYDVGGTLVPYVPNLIARSDTAVFHPLPWSIADHQLTGRAGLGLSYIGERALPYGPIRTTPTFVVDASAKVRWDFLELGIDEVQNLLNTQYPLKASSSMPRASIAPPTPRWCRWSTSPRLRRWRCSSRWPSSWTGSPIDESDTHLLFLAGFLAACNATAGNLFEAPFSVGGVARDAGGPFTFQSPLGLAGRARRGQDRPGALLLQRAAPTVAHAALGRGHLPGGLAGGGGSARPDAPRGGRRGHRDHRPGHRRRGRPLSAGSRPDPGGPDAAQPVHRLPFWNRQPLDQWGRAGHPLRGLHHHQLFAGHRRQPASLAPARQRRRLQPDLQHRAASGAAARGPRALVRWSRLLVLAAAFRWGHGDVNRRRRRLQLDDRQQLPRPGAERGIYSLTGVYLFDVTDAGVP